MPIAATGTATTGGVARLVALAAPRMTVAGGLSATLVTALRFAVQSRQTCECSGESHRVLSTFDVPGLPCRRDLVRGRFKWRERLLGNADTELIISAAPLVRAGLALPSFFMLPRIGRGKKAGAGQALPYDSTDVPQRGASAPAGFAARAESALLPAFPSEWAEAWRPSFYRSRL